MRKCPRCGNVYPDPFGFCPVDGGELAGGDGTSAPAAPFPPRESVIRTRTLARALAVLVLMAGLSFTVVFLYFYLKPKYGGLVVKTTPPGAAVVVDGVTRGVSPLTLGELRAGGHQVRVAKEGYKETTQQLEILPYSTENVHWTLEPLVPHLSNEQLAEIETWRKKLDNAQRESILLPPPEDYNALFFAGKILEIDPANAYALEVRNRIIEGLRREADVAYAKEDWLEAEKQYKNLAQVLPNDLSIGERLTDLAAKIEASVKDREQQIAGWNARAEAAFKAGSLLPPEKDNALDALRTIQRLDKKSPYARDGLTRLKELLENRGDTKLASGDWRGAQAEFKLTLQYFPDDAYSRIRLQMAESKLAEAAAREQQQQQSNQRLLEEQQRRARVAALKQSALAAYRSGAHSRAIVEWQEYLKAEPNSDEAYYYLGASNMESKQLDTAILNFERAVALNPSNAHAHLDLGVLYDRHRNNIAKAVDHLKKAKELGGAERYPPDRLQAMIDQLQASAQAAELEKLSFAAEHRHAFSSCHGRLRASDTGVEYRTTETDHSFYETYGGLRSFTISGDELTIRTRVNKKYTFRLPNPGDADRVRRITARHTLLTQ